MISLKYIRQHLKDQGYVPRHSFKGLKLACNNVSKITGLNAIDLFHLLIENEPMSGTHSYGFHTGYGRGLIEQLKSEYYLSNE